MKSLFLYFGKSQKPKMVRQEPKAKSQKLFYNQTFSYLVSLIAYCLLPIASFSQERDSLKINELDSVLISAVRVSKKAPIAFSNLDKKEISKRNLGQDIPILMNYMPSVVTTSDAGNGFGYTGIRVRGTDASRVNVTINGIPYNDSESSGTYFVDMPDFASSLQSIQLQRGVGTSTNGAGAFGASLNMLTDTYSKDASGEISSSYGSFNSRKNTVKFSTGLMNNRFEIAGRLSEMHSDGYVDRAFSNLKSYFLQGTYVGKTTLIKALVFGGNERTYQSWYGVDKMTLELDRTFNPAGQMYDANGNFEGFYNNQTDNYQQDHFQLHWNEKISKNWSSTIALHYTKGKGYYEEYVDDWYYKNVLYSNASTFDFLGLNPITVNGNLVDSMDYIRRKWLNNNFYGTTFSANYKNGNLEIIFGGAANKYEGLHYTNIIWAEYAQTTNSWKKYDAFYGNKQDCNAYSKVNYKIDNHWSIFGDMQYRNVAYQANGVMEGAIRKVYNFINPKAGLTYLVNKQNQVYFSYSVANREPSRIDFENGNPEPEKLNDYELGWRMNTSRVVFNTNLYYMDYINQLVKTGELNIVGYEIHKNVPKSYRAGVEIDAVFKIHKKLNFSPNITLSTNKIKNYLADVGNGLENFGTTSISFSPNIIAGAALNYNPINNLQMALLSKHVGEQNAGNFDNPETKLNAYTGCDFNAVYEIKPKSIFKSIVLKGQVNNIFNAKYVSNAYLYGSNYMSYFPQAGINIICGVTLNF